MPISRSNLERQLWDVVLETAGGMEIDPGTKRKLREAIGVGMERMFEARRLTDEDVLMARNSLRRLVELMMHHASLLGQQEYLREETFEHAGRALAAAQLGFALWPFWPLPGTQRGRDASPEIQSGI